MNKMKRTGLLTRSELRVSYLSFCEKFTILRKGISKNPLHIGKPGGYIGHWLFVLAITLLTFSSSPITAQNKVNTVVIDAGHGGRQPGTSGKYTIEKNITLKVALKLGAYIEQNMKDVKVLYTRTKDVAVGFDERANIANDNHADVFISIRDSDVSSDDAIHSGMAVAEFP